MSLLIEIMLPKNKTAYLISKMGMTLRILGISRNIWDICTCNSLWPLRPVEVMH